MILQKLFTSKNRIKIIEFFFFKKNESHIREVSTILKISPSAVKKETDNLIDIGILEKKSGKIVLNENNNISNDLKNIFVKTDFLYIPIKQSLGKEKIDFALIFGSFANGNFKNESDIDLLIIGNLSLDDVYKKLKEPEKQTNRAINPIVWTRKTFLEKKRSGLIRDIAKKKIMMLMGDENEFRKLVE